MSVNFKEWKLVSGQLTQQERQHLMETAREMLEHYKDNILYQDEIIPITESDVDQAIDQGRRRGALSLEIYWTTGRFRLDTWIL